MIEALYRYGNLIGKGKAGIPLDSIDVDNSYLLILDVDEKGHFKGIELTKSFPSDDKLLYKKMPGGRNPPNFSPTLRLYEVGKSIKNLNKILKSLHKFESSVPIMQDLNGLEAKARDKLEETGLIKPGNSKVNSKQNVFITLSVNGKLFGEVPVFRKAFEEFYLSKMGKLKEGVCSLCGRKTLVSGERSPFTFYTIDKIGYLSGFSKKHSLRGFPICPECYESLDRAKSEVQKYTFRLISGVSYWLIPDEVLKDVDEELLRNIHYLPYLKSRLKLKDEEKQKLSDAEEDILTYLKELQDYLTFHFVFVENNNSQEIIRLHIQDVYPSRIKELFKAKSYVEKSLGLKKEFTFKTLGQFFYKWDNESRNGSLKEYFFELLDRIFRGIQYSRPLLIKFLLNGIRQTYKDKLKGEKVKVSSKSLNALASFMFVKATTEGVMPNIESSDAKALVESLPLLSLPEAKGLFLLGVLTQRLLDKQAGSREGNEPFLKKLSDFRLNERGFKRLVPELREKMQAYEVFGKFERELFDLASEYFARSNEPWRLSLEEMNFVFAVGMGMKNKLYSGHYDKEDGHD